MNNSYIKIGNKLFQEKKYEEAIKLYYKSINQNPDFEKIVKINIEKAHKKIKNLLQININKQNHEEGVINQNKNKIKIYGNDLFEIDESLELGRKKKNYLISIIVYSEGSNGRLRLTLESLVLATENINCKIYLIFDAGELSVDYGDMFNGLEIIHNTVKKGFYLSVSECMDKCDNKNILVIKGGIIISKHAIESITNNILNEEKLNVAGFLSNGLAKELGIKEGYNISNINKVLIETYGQGKFINTNLPGVECFFSTLKAFNTVPFPRWRIDEDNTSKSLIRWFEALSLNNIDVGILLDAYIFSLNQTLNLDENINKLFDERTVDKSLVHYNNSKHKLNAVIEVYKKTNPILIYNKTICIILQSLRLGGGGIVVANLANHLILLGYDVKVYVKHQEISGYSGFDLLFKPKLMVNVDQLISELPINTIFIATLWTTARDVEKLTSKIYNSRGIYFIQDFEPLFYNPDSLDPIEISYYYKAFDSYSANIEWVYTSDWINNQFTLRGIDNPNSKYKINVGINHAIFRPTARNNHNNSKLSIVVGAMARPSTPRRGFDLLIESLNIVSNNNQIKVIFFGEEDYSPYDIKFKYENRGIVLQENLSMLYQEFDIFIDTSDFQGFGLCALEAMSAGCACIITDSGGVLEYAVHGRNSLIVKHDKFEIANAINLLSDDYAMRVRLSNFAIETAKNFDIFKSTKKWINLLLDGATYKCNSRIGVAVIIPIFNNFNVVKNCINSVLSSIRISSDIIILVDDASDLYTASELFRIKNSNESIMLIRNDINLGFVGSVNKGMNLARLHNKDIVLLNSDTIVPSNWIERLESAAYFDSNISIVSPLATDSSHLKLDLNPGDSFLLADFWLNSETLPCYPRIITPEGWCLYIPKQVYEKIGFIDEVYGRGYCEESDYCMKAFVSGFDLRCCDNLLVYHQGKASFGSERSVLYDLNRKIFDSRWSVIYSRLYLQFINKNPLLDLRSNYCNNSLISSNPSLSEFVNITEIIHNAVVVNFLNSLNSAKFKFELPKFSVSKIVFVLSELLPYGGVHSVISLSNELILRGIDSKIIVLKSDTYAGDNLNSLSCPIFLENLDDLINYFPKTDLIIATSWITIYYCFYVINFFPNIKLAYYIQDFECDFDDVRSNSELHEAAINTYKFGIPSFCKSTWLKSKIELLSNDLVKKVPPSLDRDVFYNRRSDDEFFCDVIAMYRPSTLQRDPDTLLKVIKLLKSYNSDIKIWLFGENTLSLELCSQGIIDRSLGVISVNDLPFFYSRSKIFLETSLFHGFGRTIAEAMSCGTSCVITDSGGISDFAINDFNCLISPVGDSESLFANCIKILNDDNLRCYFSNNSISSVDFRPEASAFVIADYLNIK